MIYMAVCCLPFFYNTSVGGASESRLLSSENGGIRHSKKLPSSCSILKVPLKEEHGVWKERVCFGEHTVTELKEKRIYRGSLPQLVDTFRWIIITLWCASTNTGLASLYTHHSLHPQFSPHVTAGCLQRYMTCVLKSRLWLRKYRLLQKIIKHGKVHAHLHTDG